MAGVASIPMIMNESLSPTRANPRNPISPSNYPDKKSVVAAYKRMVMSSLESHEDRAKLQKALKEFHMSLLVEDLMEKLRPLLNEPRRRQLYLAIRPLIPSRVRAEYNSHIPHVPNFEKKVVHMKQQGSRSLGFTIRGGKEFGCGIYVSSVLPSSKAAQAGLKVGDEVVRVNGLILSESTHEEVCNLIKLKKTLTLTVRVIGIIPEQDCFGNVEWKTTTTEKRTKTLNPTQRLTTAILRSTKKIQVMLDGNEVLGASIKTSSDPQSGVFITELIPNSVAHNSGLKIGDEIIEVNGHSVLNKPHKDAIAILLSSHSLMLTIRNKDPTRSAHHDPLAEPPEDFELSPHDFDVDAEMLQADLNASTMGFVLKQRAEGAPQLLRGNNQLQGQLAGHQPNRLSILGMEAGQSTVAPMISSPAAEGWGPTTAMPTLMGMMPGMPSLDESDFDQRLLAMSGNREFDPRESISFPDMSYLSNEAAVIPPSFANVFPKQPATQELQIASFAMKGSLWNPQSSGPPSQNVSGTDAAAQFQFPVDDDEEDQPGKHNPDINRQPPMSALRKSSSGGKKTPVFNESVEVISVQRNLKSNSANSIGDTVHPSNMEFNDAVLQGREVSFHTIPKDGPIKIAIRGGTDTPLGGTIIISRILEGGAADRYGRLNVGDQILVCDGVSLIEVTHNEAAQALKRAMDMESNSIDLVVAVNPDAESDDTEDAKSPRTMWPPPQDTVCEDQPASTQQFDFARNAHRAHSGFTLRGKEKVETGAAHSFLPRFPK
ncbi:harmonin-like isoform X2 [Halichondria panicea]|uniref:harmonin-like isoform X2 n=1 Tax=Halichondria panicea TaxID=6063 RepID=UPI00312B4C0F